MTGNFDAGGQAATNVGALQITGSSPTNGAGWLATNILGEGKWSLPVSFFARLSSTFTFSNNVSRTVVWDTETSDYGNNFDGTDFVIPINGIYRFAYGCFCVKVNGASGWITGDIVVNGAPAFNALLPISAATDVGSTILDTGYYYFTNGTVINCRILGLASSTNRMLETPPFSFFSGSLIRELP